MREKTKIGTKRTFSDTVKLQNLISFFAQTCQIESYLRDEDVVVFVFVVVVGSLTLNYNMKEPPRFIFQMKLSKTGPIQFDSNLMAQKTCD